MMREEHATLPLIFLISCKNERTLGLEVQQSRNGADETCGAPDRRAAATTFVISPIVTVGVTIGIAV